mgnify:CR=1 FL=1
MELNTKVYAQIRKAYKEVQDCPRKHHPEKTTRRDLSEYWAGYYRATRDLLNAFGVASDEVAEIGKSPQL